MRPIPRSLLIHTAVLNNVEIDDRHNETDVQVAMLEYVRMEPSSRVVVDSRGQDLQCTATLFVDAANSRPAGVTLHPGQTVRWMGRRYRVQTAEPLYDASRFHHWEAALSDG